MSRVYKLTYFAIKYRGEPARLTFAYAGVPFEDNIINKSNWPAVKHNYPWGTVPVLEVDGQILAQSTSIVRFLGKQFNLAGDNDFESAKCDEMVEAVVDYAAACLKYVSGKDEAKKLEIEKYLGKWNEILSKNNGFLVGNKFSYADFHLANFVEIYNDVFKGEFLTTGKYPAVVAHQNAVFNAKGIKEYVAKRPKSDW